MRIRTLLTIGMLAVLAGCAKTPQEKAVTLVSSGAVDAVLLERLRTFAERELHVRVRAEETPSLAGKDSFQTLEKSAKRIKTDADVMLIAISGIDGESQHLFVDAEAGIAAVNVPPLMTDDSEKFARRLERQVMRAAAFTMGLTPTPDPFCVTRDYRSLEDLDSMGRNFSPPWQGRFAEEAAKRGLLPPEPDLMNKSNLTPQPESN
ncbi:MAG: hypothetical protein AB7E95_11385 [Kiritimatiellales bacterium]